MDGCACEQDVLIRAFDHFIVTSAGVSRCTILSLCGSSVKRATGAGPVETRSRVWRVRPSRGSKWIVQPLPIG